MTDRISSDDPSIENVRGELARRGATSRLAIRLAEDALPTGDVVRIVLDGSERFARPQRDPGGGVTIPGIYDSPALARDPGAGDDRLQEWAGDRDLGFGRTVHVDVVEPGHRYGLRGPGEDAVYRDVGMPDDSLASIADRIENRE